MGERSKLFDSYRVTRTRDGLRIDVLDYHAGPLVLTDEDLGELGFSADGEGRPEPAARPPHRGPVREPRP